MAAVENRHQGSNSGPEHFGGAAECCSCKEAAGEDDACSSWSAKSVCEPRQEQEFGNDGHDARSSHIVMDLLTDDLLLQVREFLYCCLKTGKPADFFTFFTLNQIYHGNNLSL